MCIRDSPVAAIKKPTAAEVPMDFLISYPKVLMNGTINEPPPIPRGTEIKPIIIPEIFLTKSDIFFGFSISFSLTKIKNNPISPCFPKNLGLGLIVGIIRKYASDSRWHGPPDDILAVHSEKNPLDIKSGFLTSFSSP